jgi:hypothetical protein
MAEMEDEIDLEMRIALRRAGVTVPPERWAAMRHAFISYQDLATVLDEPLPYRLEPAALYILAPLPESAQ